MMSSENPKLFEYFLKGINALSKEIDFTGWEHCLDFQYYSEKSLVVCSLKIEDEKCEIYLLDVRDYITIGSGIILPVGFLASASKQIDRQGGNLYLRTGINEIQIHVNIVHKLSKMRGSSIVVNNIPGDEVTDFTPVGMNRLITLSGDGRIAYFEFHPRTFNYGQIAVSKSNVFKLDEDEICNCVSVCSKGHYMIVCTLRRTMKEDEMSHLLSRMFLIKIVDPSIIKIRKTTALPGSGKKGSKRSEGNDSIR
jgi:hypothetical protein